ncbi:MAG: NAD(P)-binding protein [Solirubrobacterales bacterium]
MDRAITRRDFLDGAARAAGGLTLGSLALSGCDFGIGGEDEPSATYPPDLTGMRGQTDGAMRIPHELRDGTFWESAGTPRDTGERYDLVVVGAGISGLAAARFFQREHGGSARILLLDTLSDFGGHAARNEFETSARTLIGYGGSQTLDTPSAFHAPARELLDDVGIELKRFPRYFDDGFNKRHGLRHGVFFDREHYGSDHLSLGDGPREILEEAPLRPAAKADLLRLSEDPPDYLAGLADRKKKERLTELTYLQYLRRYAKPDEQALTYLQRISNDYWGYGIDAVGAIDAWADGYPGFRGLGLDYSRPYRTNAPTEHQVWYSSDPYVHHFPEGNAGVALSIVRRLIPDAVPGKGMESIPTARTDYGRLDADGNRVRIRLSSPVVRVRHDGRPGRAREVEVAFVRGGELQSVRGERVVLACWNAMIPYICEELPRDQREALAYATKLALVYTNVQIRNWTSFANLGLSGARFPSMYWLSVTLDFPVSMGEYRFPDDPEEPILLHLPRAPCEPGLSPREQGKAGRAELLSTSFEDMEREVRDQTARLLEPGGFDPARDIEAITVNRWAHGYAYEYARPWDRFWPDGPLPSHTARRRFGRIAIANSDSAPRAYADTAIDMAYRAVRDLEGKRSPEVSRGVDGVTAG